MKTGPDIAFIGSLIGDPARANMLTALMGGRALTATELAQEAGVTPQTASSHLAKLETKGFSNIGFLRDSYLRVTGDGAFEAGLKLILDGLAAERKG